MSVEKKKHSRRRGVQMVTAATVALTMASLGGSVVNGINKQINVVQAASEGDLHAAKIEEKDLIPANKTFETKATSNKTGMSVYTNTNGAQKENGKDYKWSNSMEGNVYYLTNIAECDGKQIDAYITLGKGSSPAFDSQWSGSGTTTNYGVSEDAESPVERGLGDYYVPTPGGDIIGSYEDSDNSHGTEVPFKQKGDPEGRNSSKVGTVYGIRFVSGSYSNGSYSGGETWEGKSKISPTTDGLLSFDNSAAGTGSYYGDSDMNGQSSSTTGNWHGFSYTDSETTYSGGYSGGCWGGFADREMSVHFIRHDNKQPVTVKGRFIFNIPNTNGGGSIVLDKESTNKVSAVKYVGNEVSSVEKNGQLALISKNADNKLALDVNDASSLNFYFTTKTSDDVASHDFSIKQNLKSDVINQLQQTADSNILNTDQKNTTNNGGFNLSLIATSGLAYVVDPGHPRDDIEGAHYDDLHKTVVRDIIINDPHSGKKTIHQEVKFQRNAIVEGDSKKISSYDDWQVEGKGNFDKVSVPGVDGYKASRGDVEARNVNATDKDETIDVNYTANDQSVTYNFVDQNGKKVGDQTFKGKTDQTVDLNFNLPKNYHFAEDANAPKSYKFKASGNDAVNLKVTSLSTIRPSKNGEGAKFAKDLTKTVTRTVNITDPHTKKTNTTTQTVNFTRTAVYDAATDKLSNFGSWTADGKANFDKVDVPEVAGYTPSGQAPAATPKGEDKDSTIDIIYSANDQAMNIVYQTKEGKEVGRHQIKGKTDQTITIADNDVKSNWVPDGYELVQGASVPSSVTFKGAHTDDIVLKVVSVSKTELENAIKKGQGVQASDKFKHADEASQKALNDAVTQGQTTDKNARATQEQVNSAKKAIDDAINKVDESAKAGLKNLIKDGKTDQGRDKYKKAPEAEKKALDDAIANGQKTVDNPEATQKDIDDASKPITDAMNAIDKTAKDALTKSIAKGQADQKTTKYGASTDAEKKALDDAITNGQKVLADPNVDSDQIDAAKKAIDDAMTNIDKGAKAGLEDAIKKGEAAQNTDKYKNDTDPTKKALDDAIANGKKIADDPDASKEDIDKAHQAIDDAINKIDQEAKKGLEDSIKKGEAAEKSDKLNTATEAEKKALDDAIKNGHTVDNDPNATQKQIDDAKKALDNAVTAIDKTAKHDLDGAIDKGKKEQQGDKYKHASKDDQKNLDDAIKKAEDISKDPNATQKDIDDAKKAIDDAIKKIDDDAKKGLNDAIKKGEEVQKTDKYQNAPEDLKKALDDAIENGKKIAADPNATQEQIDAAQKAIENAIKSIDADAKKGLEESIQKAQDPQTQDKTSKVSDETKKNLDDALKKAQDVDTNPDASKKDIDDAKKALDDATAKVDKEAKAGLEDAIKKGEDAQKSQKYKDASDEERKALDDALEEAKKVDADDNASAAAIDNATKKLNEASEKIDGLANKEDLKRAIANANDAKNTDKYKEATDAGKKNLDDALAKAEKAVKDPDVSQKDVDQATTDLNNAVNGLDQAHKSVTIDPSKPVKKGDKIPGTDIVSKGGLEENDLNHTVTRTINWSDPKGNKHVEKQTAKFTRTATIDLVTQKITYGAWSNGGKQVLPAFTPKLEGYTVTGSVPATTVTPNDKDITVNNASFTFTATDTGKTTTTDGDKKTDQGTTGDNQSGNTDDAKNSQGQSGSGQTDKDNNKTDDKGGILPQTGHWVVKNAKALMIALGAAMAGLGGWLVKRKRDEKKESEK